jgi:hypothetical protein
MEIDTNSGRVAQPGYPQSVTRPKSSPSTSTQADSQTATTDLTNRLQQLPLVRPEKVSEAKKLLLDDKYPPEDVLDRIAVLLAVRLDEEA